MVVHAGPGGALAILARLSYLDRVRDDRPPTHPTASARNRPVVELDVTCAGGSVVSGLAGMTEYTTITERGVMIASVILRTKPGHPAPRRPAAAPLRRPAARIGPRDYVTEIRGVPRRSARDRWLRTEH